MSNTPASTPFLCLCAAGKEPNKGVNPDEAVAYGAAVQVRVTPVPALNGSGARQCHGLAVVAAAELRLRCCLPP